MQTRSLADIIADSSKSATSSNVGSFDIDPDFIKIDLDKSKELQTDPVPDLGTKDPDLENISGKENKIKKSDDDEDDEIDPFNAKEFAELIVTTEDFVQSKVLAYLHKKTLYDEYERDRVDELLYNRSIKPEAMTRYDNLLLKRLEDHTEYEKELPFTDPEIKKLSKRWKAVLKDKNVELSPGWALVMQTAVIMIPRSLPIFGNMFDKKDRSQRYAAERNTLVAEKTTEQKQQELKELQQKAELIKKELEKQADEKKAA